MSYEPPPSPNPAAQPAGWYPDNSGQQRYWDGAAWTEHVAPAAAPAADAFSPPQQQYAQQGYGQAVATGTTADDRTMATLAHALGIFAGFLGPLLILLLKGDQSVYVKHQATEALNFTITVAIAMTVAGISVLLLIGFVLFPIVWLGSIILQIMAALAANRGEWYRYPLTLRLVSGPSV